MDSDGGQSADGFSIGNSLNIVLAIIYESTTDIESLQNKKSVFIRCQ